MDFLMIFHDFQEDPMINFDGKEMKRASTSTMTAARM